MSVGSEHAKKRQGLKTGLRAVHKRLSGGELTARRLAQSVALGLFVGCSPFFGFHAIIALGLAFTLRLDVLISYLATNISVPPLLPFLIFAELQVGSFLVSGRFHSLTLADFAPQKALELGALVLAGFPVVGGVVALLGGAVAYLVGAHIWNDARLSSSEPRPLE